MNLKKLTRQTLILILPLLLSFRAEAKITLPSVISDNMVLQQKAVVPLWGKAEPNSKVRLKTSWSKKEYTQIAGSDGSWKITIPTPSAGGPFNISISDGEALELKNVMVGEVWLCSGQSNMEMPLRGFTNQPVLNAREILAEAAAADIRLFRAEKASSAVPKDDLKSTSWQVSDSASVSQFSAVAFQYGKILKEKLNVPVGLILSSWGGTAIEAWMEPSSLSPFEEFKIPEPTASKIDKNDPGVLFNAMINPIVGYGIKGCIWYQGEQNRFKPEGYDKLMAAMVSSWRNLWKQGEWPFYYVQIAPYRYKDGILTAARLREAQSAAQQQISKSGMVVTMDIGTENNIHPPDKTTVSKRLAALALTKTYGGNEAFAGPAFKEIRIRGNEAQILFANAEKGLRAEGQLQTFEIAGEDRIFHVAKARIEGNSVFVQSDEVNKPVAVRYAYKDWIVGDLFNKEGQPADPFRTDKWNDW